MPFIDKLKHWAVDHGGRTALIVGGQRLTYSELLQAAESQAAEAHSVSTSGARGVSVIDRPSSAELVVDFCAALFLGHTSMILDASWPAALRAKLTQAAQSWSSVQDPAVQPFLLGLSSGTSGLPKAFVRTTESWRVSFVRSAKYFELGPDSVTLTPGPLAASMNLYALGESIHAGSTLVALPRFSPDAALDAMEVHGVTRLVLVPTVLELMAARGMATGRDGGQLRSIVCAGSALPERTLTLARKWAPHARIQQYYGAAELGFVAASTVEPSAVEPSGARAVGTAFPGVDISIRDNDGCEMAAGEQGHICVRSPYVCSGYAWGDDGLAFGEQATSWYTVRDQGHVDQNGVLHVSGRASEMIVTAGANVYPHAVEEGLAAAAGAACTIVVAGVMDGLRGQRVAAGIFNPTGPDAIDLAALRLAAAQLPAQQRPGSYYFLSDLPLIGSGKTSRAMLGQWISEGDARAQRLH
ncbi:class I adenylate-forming enzyme family protein [Arthrobacter sp.]|uniref:class I adenylate-forming enzyme family protein n=1 Tax=Arthrobacter sp. TaxID=1667 RepID=UPI0026E0063D|nr:AMP-binding protein [Arthrobacter sp.]MDO5752228.1 AMP-binding protein [Arthrobacter sp.]